MGSDLGCMFTCNPLCPCGKKKMTIYYFAKEIPQTPVYLSSGNKLTFDTADGNTGYVMTADPGMASQLNMLIQKGVGGIRVATAEEYEAFIELKKNYARKKQWREELRPGGDYAPDSVGRGAAAVEEPRRATEASISNPKPPEVRGEKVETPDKQVDFKPNTRRKK